MNKAPRYTVYSKGRGCGQCVATLRYLDKAEQTYRVRDLAEAEALHEALEILPGATTAPVVLDTWTGQSWAGFRPDLLDR